MNNTASDTEVTQSRVVGKLFDPENETRFEYILQTNTSDLFLIIDIFLLLPLCYFHYLMICMLKRESKARKGQDLIKELLGCYSFMVPITFLGASAYLDIMTRYLNTPILFRGFWFCLSFELYIHVSTIYIGGFSVYVALLKYWRIVHNPTATNYGEHKARKICFVLHLFIPILISILNSVSNGRIDQIFSVDHCWSLKIQDDIMNIHLKKSASEKFNSLFCVDRKYGMEAHFGATIGHNIERILRVLCGSVKIFYLFLLSNIFELIIYILIFKYLNR